MKRLTMLAAVLPLLVSCSDPCDTLSAKVCADLGSDCNVWQETVKDQVVPLESLRAGRQRITAGLLKQRAEDKFCRNLAADENYAGYTLPFVKHLVKSKKDPANAGPAPKLPMVQPVSDFPPWLMYALGPVSVIGMLGYLFIYNRRRSQAG